MKRAAALLIALVLVLAACGDDDAGSDTTAAGGDGPTADVVDELTQEILADSSTGSDIPFSDEQAACFAVGLVDEFGAETMVDALQMEFEEFMAGATPEQRMTVVDAMFECVDFGALMAAEMGDAVSAESAECIGDAFTSNDAFREALAASFVSDVDPFEDDALFAEVFPSLLECLSAEELINLGDFEG